MENLQSSRATGPHGSSSNDPRPNDTVASTFKRECLSISTTLQQGFRYVRAIFAGQAKKMTAKNEKEAAEADLLTSKMQVDAADDAENTKKRINKSY